MSEAVSLESVVEIIRKADRFLLASEIHDIGEFFDIQGLYVKLGTWTKDNENPIVREKQNGVGKFVYGLRAWDGKTRNPGTAAGTVDGKAKGNDAPGLEEGSGLRVGRAAATTSKPAPPSSAADPAVKKEASYAAVLGDLKERRDRIQAKAEADIREITTAINAIERLAG